MCGIAGIFEFGGSSTRQLPHAVKMACAMRHRGPDDEGYALFSRGTQPFVCYGDETPQSVRISYPETESASDATIESQVVLAHRRLSIIDISPAGHQPMQSQNGRFWMVYNGEVYNYIELREELRALGHIFRGDSDTEVILAAYGEWGSGCLERFNGDWALLIYDREDHKVFVSRDRFGIKPLYYYQDKDRIVFASEIKGLLAHPEVKSSPDLDYLKRYVSVGATEWLGETAFSNIRRFPFAHYALIDLANAGELITIRYWDVEANISQETFDAVTAKRYAEKYLDLLKDAVRIRLRSDVPLGCALSGGLDSSSIVYLANELQKNNEGISKVVTFSSVYNSPETKYCDESYYIDLLQKHLGFHSYKMEPKPEDVPYLAEIVLRQQESPPEGLGMSGISTITLARDIGLKVTLDGQGADEVQAGYEMYLVIFLGNLKWPDCIREIQDVNNEKYTSRLQKKIIIAALVRKIIGVKLLMWLIKMDRQNITLEEKYLNDALRHSVCHGLVNLIHYSDSRSMYYSIESRMPFMDHRVIKFSLSVPECYKIHNGYTKYFARLAFDGKLPDEITWRKDKMGWPVPVEHWLSGPLGSWVDKMTGNSVLLSRIGMKHCSNTTDIKKRIRLFNIAMWEKVFLFDALNA